MSRLTDLLGKSLPSQTENFNESSDFDFDTDDYGFENVEDDEAVGVGSTRDGIKRSRDVNRAGYANDSNKGYGLTGDARDEDYEFRGSEERDDQDGYGLKGGAVDARYSYKGRPKTNAQYGYGLTGDAPDANYSVGATGYSESDYDDFDDFDNNFDEFEEFDDDLDFNEYEDDDYDFEEFEDDDFSDEDYDEFGDLLGGEQYSGGFEDGEEEDLGTPLDDDLADDEELGDDEIDDLDDIDFSDDDLSDLSDEDLDALAMDIEDDEMSDLIGGECGGECGDECGECGMSIEAEERADDIFAAAGTPMLIESVLSADEKKDLLNNQRELSILVNDGLMFESDIEDLRLAFGDEDTMFEAMYNGPTKVKWSVETIKARLFGTAIFACATAAKDTDLLKYRKLRKMARVYKAKLRKKYKTPALQRMRVLFKRLKASKSGAANKASKVLK